MAVYNGMPYLKEAVVSILRQTYKNFEFVIVDDASDDNSPKYLKSIKDKRVTLIINKQNLGLARSLNIGLQKASGKYIARMDADDISLPNRFHIQLQYLLEHPQIDLCGCWVDLINEKGQKIGEKKYPIQPDKVKNAITWYAAVIHPTFMAKSDFFKKLDGYRINYDHAEDYDLLSRAKNKFKMANVGRKLLLWRQQKYRRSRENMAKMDKLDLTIKMESLKRDGLSTNGILALIKKIIMIYCLPLPIKYQLATLFKLA
ncbi:MAG: glycosyltransferase family 2 protein [bacterium]|nr:glycosyltransferase family 2 protein [bacterium]